MTEPVPAGSDVSSGSYKCTECGYRLGVQSTTHLPPCPKCNNGYWVTITDGDSPTIPTPTAKASWAGSGRVVLSINVGRGQVRPKPVDGRLVATVLVAEEGLSARGHSPA